MICRGLVILIFDSLRKDFRTICAEHGVTTLPAFDRLDSLTVCIPEMRCGSFPTVPMRTDILTGRLAFLERRWARPTEHDLVFTSLASSSGVRTNLITDNYMMILPELGGTLDAFFDRYMLERGAGSDPWQRFDQRNSPSSGTRPVRSEEFEAQFIANVQAWNGVGGAPWIRLFNVAESCLNRTLRDERFVLWVDCFSTHEPWPRSSELMSGKLADDEPISPPYGAVYDYKTSQIAALRKQYATRIADVDEAMRSFVESLEHLVNRGDIALALLSDHGFLFGEYGVVGKPASSPVLPPLYDLVARFTPHIAQSLTPDLLWQPHDLTGVFSRILGVHAPWSVHPIPPDRPQFIGRNSPDSPALTVATRNGFALLFRDHLDQSPRWYANSSLNPKLHWKSQGVSEIPKGELYGVRIRKIVDVLPWLAEFRVTLDRVMLS